MFSSADVVSNFNQILPKATNLQNPNEKILKNNWIFNYNSTMNLYKQVS